MKAYAKVVHAHADLVRARQERQTKKNKPLNKTRRSGSRRKAVGPGPLRPGDEAAQ
jgi:hypothetical protein